MDASPVSSVALLGLDPNAFRLVSDDEMKEEDMMMFGHHRDGSHCHCRWDCDEGEDSEEEERQRLLKAGCF